MAALIKRYVLGIAALGVATLTQPALAQDIGCVTYNSSQMRTFVIQKVIKVGMTQAQIKRSWGEPTKVRNAYPAGDEWEYWNPAGDQVVTFGSHGCVTGWYTHRD